MAVPLPPAVRLPLNTRNSLLPPSNPPSSDDVVRAMQYTNAVSQSFMIHEEEVTADDVSAALVYKAAIIAAKQPEAATPPWFAAKMDAINQRFSQLEAAMNQRFDQQEATINAMQDLLVKVDYTSSIIHNQAAVDGSKIPFKEVPFPDGTYPTQAPYRLPIIESINGFTSMQHHHIKKYHQLYCPGQPEALDDEKCIDEVLEKIGCYV